MDQFFIDHFHAWLDRNVPEHLRAFVAFGVERMIADHPDLLDTHSWPEIARLADVL